jgi:hypothetical protein
LTAAKRSDAGAGRVIVRPEGSAIKNRKIYVCLVSVEDFFGGTFPWFLIPGNSRRVVELLGVSVAGSLEFLHERLH